MYATHLDLSLALYKAIKKIQVRTTRYIRTCRMFYVSVQTTRLRVSICLIEVRLYSTIWTCQMFYVSVQTTRRHILICSLKVRLYSTLPLPVIPRFRQGPCQNQRQRQRPHRLRDWQAQLLTTRGGEQCIRKDSDSNSTFHGRGDM
jgi:hypothetical protein